MQGEVGIRLMNISNKELTPIDRQFGCEKSFNNF